MRVKDCVWASMIGKERDRERERESERVCERWVTVKEVREEILLLPELVFI